MPTLIAEFAGEYAFLSNFYSSPITAVWNNVFYEYKTVEHAFQAAKATTFAWHERIRKSPSPGMAKSAGRKCSRVTDWESIKDGVMLQLLYLKFAKGTPLAAQLMVTDPAHLVEGNNWHDNYWGNCVCGRQLCETPGRNTLGRQLTAVRQSLRFAQYSR